MNAAGRDAATPPPLAAHGSAAFWLTWIVGPCSYGAAFGLCWRWPGFCDDPPNLLLACMLVVTHLGAGMATLLLLLRPAERRRSEFWLLMLYWLCIGLWLWPGNPRQAFVCKRIAAVLVLAMPAGALLRGLWRRSVGGRDR